MNHRENIDAFRVRTRGFMSHSLYDRRHFGVSGGLWAKVSEDGRFNPFYGNTVIFEMSGADKQWLAQLQDELYRAADAWAAQSGRKRFLAEKLQPDTFHITLHDLLNSPNYDDVAEASRAMAPLAEAKLAEIRAEYPQSIYMRPVFMFNMMNTSVLIGFEPCSEADCDALMALYDEFQQPPFRYLDYALTPHVTLAYYRPDAQGYDGEMVAALEALFARVNHTLGRRVVELKLADLHHRFFNDMNHYRGELLRCNPIDSYCGLMCDTCEFRASMNCGGCIATGGKPFHGKCDVADCANAKGNGFCGDCGEFPCAVLKDYSFDPVHGDDGARIENIRRQMQNR